MEHEEEESPIRSIQDLVKGHVYLSTRTHTLYRLIHIYPANDSYALVQMEVIDVSKRTNKYPLKVGERVHANILTLKQNFVQPAY